jgi:Domain of unknown function (DUF4279)
LIGRTGHLALGGNEWWLSRLKSLTVLDISAHWRAAEEPHPALRSWKSTHKRYRHDQQDPLLESLKMSARMPVPEVRLGDRSSERRKVLPFRPVETSQVLADVGGPIDEVNVTLALYSDELEPQEISRALGVEPTSAHRRGERRGPRSPPAPSGAWLLTTPGRDAERVEDVIDRLLKQLPEDLMTWRDLRMRHDIQVRFGLHMTGWNKGLSIPLKQVTRIAELGASMEFDIYAYSEDE